MGEGAGVYRREEGRGGCAGERARVTLIPRSRMTPMLAAHL